MIRLASIDDVDDIERIERESFATPWSRTLILEELCFPLSFNLVLEIKKKVEGYVMSWLILPEVHILNLAISARYRRKGYGRYLLEGFLEEAQNKGATKITLEVRKSNVEAINLYKEFNFAVKGVRKNYYFDTGEDALIMWKEL